MVQRVGDQGDNSNQNVQVAAAGEDLELECISTGANPPAKLKWFMMKPDSTLEEIPNGHSQDNRRADNARTWTSISRLNLPISKDDNKGKIKCIAEHPALQDELATETSLIIHCEYFDALLVRQHVCFATIVKMFPLTSKFSITLTICVTKESSFFYQKLKY